MEIITFLGLMYLTISLSVLVMMLCRLSSKYMEYPTAFCTIIGSTLTVLFLCNYNWIGFIWLFNSLLSAYNTYSIYQENKEQS